MKIKGKLNNISIKPPYYFESAIVSFNTIIEYLGSLQKIKYFEIKNNTENLTTTTLIIKVEFYGDFNYHATELKYKLKEVISMCIDIVIKPYYDISTKIKFIKDLIKK